MGSSCWLRLVVVRTRAGRAGGGGGLFGRPLPARSFALYVQVHFRNCASPPGLGTSLPCLHSIPPSPYRNVAEKNQNQTFLKSGRGLSTPLSLHSRCRYVLPACHATPCPSLPIYFSLLFCRRDTASCTWPPCEVKRQWVRSTREEGGGRGGRGARIEGDAARDKRRGGTGDAFREMRTNETRDRGRETEREREREASG